MFIVIMWELMDESATISGLATKGPILFQGQSKLCTHTRCRKYTDDFRDFSVLGWGCCVTAVGDIQLGDIFHDDIFRIHFHETVAAVAAGTIDQGR